MKRSKTHEQTMRWLAENQTFLDANYAGMWVAIGAEGFAGAGKTFSEALDAAEASGVMDSVVLPVMSKELQGIYIIR